MGSPVPSIPRYMGGASTAIFSTQARSSAAIAVPSASAARCTWLMRTSTPANVQQGASFLKAHHRRRAACLT
jgi:hypothetical protein